MVRVPAIAILAFSLIPAAAFAADSDGDGLPDASEVVGDTDRYGMPDYLDSDDDNDGIGTLYERQRWTADGGAAEPCGLTANYLVADSDGDGVRQRARRR